MGRVQGGGVAIESGVAHVEYALLGDSQRRGVLGMDEAEEAVCVEALCFGPGQRRRYGLGGIAFALHGGGDDPADSGWPFSKRGKRRFEFAAVIEDADLADELSRRLLLDAPVAEAEQRPLAEIPQQRRPGVLGRKRLAADVAGDGLIRLQSAVGREVVERLGAQSQAGCLDGRNFKMEGGSGRHGPF